MHLERLIKGIENIELPRHVRPKIRASTATASETPFPNHSIIFGVAFGFNGYTTSAVTICDIEIIMESVVDIIAAKALYEIRKKKE